MAGKRAIYLELAAYPVSVIYTGVQIIEVCSAACLNASIVD
jgi:hypothetical protein